MIRRAFFGIGILIVLSGCGYRVGMQPFFYEEGLSLCIEGDQKGVFEDALVEELSAQGISLSPCSSSLLSVCLFPSFDENIGFRQNKNNQGKREKTLTPCETRLFATAEITLYQDGEILLDPVRVRVSFDFDHNGLGNLDALNVFSLGQLSSRDEAIITAEKPLFSLLAKKIAATLLWNTSE